MATHFVSEKRESRLQRAPSQDHSSTQNSYIVIGRRIIVPLIAILTWEFTSRVGIIDAMLFSRPSQIVEAFGSEIQSGALLRNLLASLERILFGFGIAAVTAIPLGMLLGVSIRTREYLGALLEFLRPIPPLALIPVTILWLGIGDMSKIAIIAYASFWPILLNSISGVTQIPMIIDQTATMLDIRGIRRFAKILLPGSIPSIITGLRVSIGIAVIVVVAAEMVAASSGLGYAVLQSERVFETPTMYCYIVTLSILGVGMNLILLLAEKRIARWR